jgi:hypothetical protein
MKATHKTPAPGHIRAIMAEDKDLEFMYADYLNAVDRGFKGTESEWQAGELKKIRALLDESGGANG